MAAVSVKRSISKGANKILGLIRRNFWFYDEKIKLTLYKIKR